MLQNLIVAVIVAIALVYTVWRWMPAAWRRDAARGMATGSRRAGLVNAQQAERLATSLAKDSGCGACDSCQQCAPAADATQRKSKDVLSR